MLYDKVIPFDRSGFFVGVSIKEVGERTPRDDCKPVVATLLGQAAFLTNGRFDRAAASKVSISKPPDPRLRVQRLVTRRSGM
jgi:hypothetical protein